MPISPPRLDDRNFEDLVDELLARIPAHTPEWVPQPGDPGRTLLELFAWLGETILYRANLVPERQRLAFLKLLGEQMQPAQAAREDRLDRAWQAQHRGAHVGGACFATGLHDRGDVGIG